MRGALVAAGLMAAAFMAGAQAPAPPNPALEAALRNFPPLIVGGNVERVVNAGDPIPPPCPVAGGRVEQKGAPALEFLGADPADPALCRIRVGADTISAWYGIWDTTWPAADQAHRALDRVLHSRTGDTAGFDTVGGPGYAYHDIIRHDGVEAINILGTTYRAIKLAHYREGYDGNTYRSVSTLWIDTVSGLPVYGTYQHIAGRPEIDDPLIPTAIIPAR